MNNYNNEIDKSKIIFVGIDVHSQTWHVTIRTHEQELFSRGIPGSWKSLRGLLDRHKQAPLQVVYEAGYFGFWLHDCIVEYGAECIVTPPSLLPQEYGNRVKTDRRDSRKLAMLLAKGMLKKVWVPGRQELYHRHVLRRRRQLVGDRIRLQNRIKADLRFYGIEIPKHHGKWSKVFIASLYQVQFGDHWIKESFIRLLEHYEFLSQQIGKQTRLIRELSEATSYKERVWIMCSIPGIGLLSAMEILVELQDFTRFKRSDQLAAYVGLTPSQYSSADKIRMGRISKAGKNALRGVLVEAAWMLIRKDEVMREKFDRISHQAGSKRAIVAIARRLLIRIRRMLLDEKPYIKQIAA
jgi:transposase